MNPEDFELKVYSLVQPVTQARVITALTWLSIYMVYMFLAAKLIPGTKAKGVPDSKGKSLDYNCNGLQIFILTQILYFLGYYYYGFSLFPVIQHFWSFCVAANILAFSISFILFFVGRSSLEYQPHLQTWTPQWLNDFWFGATRNPRFLGVDLKMFFYQPSLIGLLLILFAFAEYQYTFYGGLTTNIILFLTFWWLWLFTHYVKEDFMLTTWDILAENFGFMLVWGDMVFLPFIYCICGWYIADLPTTLNGFTLVLVLVLGTFGLFLLRDSNWQKFDFKKHGMKATIWGEAPKTIGDKLLISGWWGFGRHLNYTGEIILYLAMALCCGGTSWVPFFLPVNLFNILSHRANRDDKRCREKYGKIWEEYCKIATFKVIPYVF